MASPWLSGPKGGQLDHHYFVKKPEFCDVSTFGVLFFLQGLKERPLSKIPAQFS